MSVREVIIFFADALLSFLGAVSLGALVAINMRDGFLVAINVFGGFLIVYHSICSLTIFTRVRYAIRIAAGLAIVAFFLDFLVRI